MPYVFYMENVKGRPVKWAEPESGDSKDAKLMKPYGNEITGTLALQTFPDRPYRRLTFADGKNVLFAAGKKIGSDVGIAKEKNPLAAFIKVFRAENSNNLCCFDFSDDEIALGEKEIRLEMQLVNDFFPIYTMMCYDSNTHRGTAYLFNNRDSLEAWGKQLGIHKISLLADSGKFEEYLNI